MKQKLLPVLFSLATGILLGLIAKYSDTVTGSGLVWGLISQITTGLGLWVFLATLIAAWSQSPGLGALKVFAFFVGMLAAYYLYSMQVFGFFPIYHFVRWGGIALASPVAAYIAWYSRRTGWGAALCAALPAGLLLELGYHFVYTLEIALAFDLLAGASLLLVLPSSNRQRLLACTMAFVLAVLLRCSGALAYLFGGL
ncbi:MAG: hypothetical protein ACM3XM_00085 [Mycobacterium leprae]